MKLPILFHRGLPLAAFAVFSVGCTTTGDPSQGGLFGWSANKADQRAASYHAQLHEENRRLESEEITSARLSRQQQKLTTDINAINAELSQLLLDVQQIEQSGNSNLSHKAASVRGRIEEANDSARPDGQQVRALRREVESLREEMGLLQQRQ